MDEQVHRKVLFSRESKFIQSMIDEPWKYECCNLRDSVSGDWGSIRAAIGNVQCRGSEGEDSTMVVYILVDGYENARQHSTPESPSKWQVAKLLCAAMRAGVSLQELYAAIVKVIVGAVGPINPLDMVRLYAKYYEAATASTQNFNC